MGWVEQLHIENDGSARELTEAEKRYVDTEFSPFDGARPYLKSCCWQQNAWGELRGYLHRKEVPDGVPIDPAPTEGTPQQTRQAAADAILEMIRTHRPGEEHKIRFKPPSNQDIIKHRGIVVLSVPAPLMCGSQFQKVLACQRLIPDSKNNI